MVVKLRFIPALAGNTRLGLTAEPEAPVHPRARGEHVSIGTQTEWSYGSSPRSRGTHHPHGGEWDHQRFIPALAGNTDEAKSPATAGAVHPRARGEHIDLSSLTSAVDGSSPHSRGTHFILRPRS